MNVSRIRRLAAYLRTMHEVTPSRFQMNSWARESSCGTVGCIGGHAVSLFNPKGLTTWDVQGAAQYELDLTDEQCENLFLPNNKRDLGYRAYDVITALHAARVLENFADTGVIDWSVAFKEDA